MIGCLALAQTTSVRIDEQELEDARWFYRARKSRKCSKASPAGAERTQPHGDRSSSDTLLARIRRLRTTFDQASTAAVAARLRGAAFLAAAFLGAAFLAATFFGAAFLETACFVAAFLTGARLRAVLSDMPSAVAFWRVAPSVRFSCLAILDAGSLRARPFSGANVFLGPGAARGRLLARRGFGHFVSVSRHNIGLDKLA